MKKTVSLKRYQKQSKIIFILTVVSCTLLVILFAMMVINSMKNEDISSFRSNLIALNLVGIIIFIQVIVMLYNWKNIKGTLMGMALRDQLTGCFNRNYFDEFYGEQLRIYNRYKHIFSVALIDIDDFKKINDTYGHDIGDLVLKELVQTIRQNLRSTDVLVRYGGEEFLVLFPASDLLVVKGILENIKRIIEERSDFSSGTLTISIGAASVNQTNDENVNVIKLADLALYYAKGNGKNQVKCFNKNMNN